MPWWVLLLLFVAVAGTGGAATDDPAFTWGPWRAAGKGARFRIGSGGGRWAWEADGPRDELVSSGIYTTDNGTVSNGRSTTTEQQALSEAANWLNTSFGLQLNAP